ncbi:Ethylene-insensitive protein 2 [Stylosanthes scabra]|uniref:Ethylene-insensitive protein 2 n=1 Tax=Stylosanthes scabra TaxID=79078 RepID=A0ABU6RA32_9FABA|nr:Ethylene-insensitive protein 2 [Stylosanthes scabra]
MPHQPKSNGAKDMYIFGNPLHVPVIVVEGGARFGFDLMAFMLIFNFAAIFCQYTFARIGVITGRDLAQVCSKEYDTWTCIFLGIQAELSVIMLDLNMDVEKAKILGHIVAGFVLFTFVLGLLINRPENSLSMNGIQTKLSWESAFVLMGLLGATLVPHNF